MAAILRTTLIVVLAWSHGVPEADHVSTPSGITVLVLDNCDSDYKTLPFEDAVLVLVPGGRFAKNVAGINICQTVGGHRAMSASADGTSLVVCENVGNKITAYETKTGTGSGHCKENLPRLLYRRWGSYMY